jgi:hypothetical protein
MHIIKYTMNNLEFFLDKFNNEKITSDIYNKYNFFGYKDKKTYILDLKFLIENVYKIEIIEESRKRINQKEFRQILLEKYSNKCIITGSFCEVELTACHIIPITDGENYDLDNGILLKENLHRTYDNYYWSINPFTKKVEINKNISYVGEIYDYKDVLLNLSINSTMFLNLKYHYSIFLEKSEK